LAGTGTVLNYKAIVAIDSLGRNVAYNANLYDSSHLQNTSPPYDFSTPTNAANFIQIDLG
jgi:hypothetical protein